MRSVRGEGEIRGIMLIPWGRGSATVCMFDENQKWGLGDPFWAQEAKEVYGGEPSLEQCAEPRKTELAVGLREDRTQ